MTHQSQTSPFLHHSQSRPDIPLLLHHCLEEKHSYSLYQKKVILDATVATTI